MDSVTARNKELEKELTRAGEQLSQLRQQLCETTEARDQADAKVKVGSGWTEMGTAGLRGQCEGGTLRPFCERCVETIVIIRLSSAVC